MELTENQARGKQQSVEYRRDTLQNFLKTIADAEAMTRHTGCIEKYGMDLYRIKNSVLLDLAALDR